jgi:hypothetical protein
MYEASFYTAVQITHQHTWTAYCSTWSIKNFLSNPMNIFHFIRDHILNVVQLLHLKCYKECTFENTSPFKLIAQKLSRDLVRHVNCESSKPCFTISCGWYELVEFVKLRQIFFLQCLTTQCNTNHVTYTCNKQRYQKLRYELVGSFF